MTNNDFELAFRRQSSLGDDHSSGSGRERLSVEDLEVAFEALGEEIFLVDRTTGDILWMSPACTKLTHKLGSSANIGEFPALKKMVYAAIPGNDRQRTHARWYSNDGTWEQYIGDHNQSSISVYCNESDTGSVWVRLTRYTDREDYFRKYVAEQEELFNTARSVSVGEIATTLAHELNQPLGTLINIVNGIKSRLDASMPEADDMFKALELAERQGQFASEILLRVRSFAQARQPVMKRFSVKQLINDTLDLLDWKFQAEGVSVSFSVEQDDLSMNGDSTLLQQVLVNLLRNAVESMANVTAGDKMIHVVATHSVSGVGIDVRDTGHGINSDKMDELFTLFRSSKPYGMGVGLNICLSFIELHNGKFWFTQNEDQGCTAHILIPG